MALDDDDMTSTEGPADGGASGTPGSPRRRRGRRC